MFLDLDEYNKDVNSDIKNPISFNSPDSFFGCNPGKCTFDVQSTELASNESYSFCGGQALEDTSFSCSISNSENVVTKILESGASAISGDMENVEEVRGAEQRPADFCISSPHNYSSVFAVFNVSTRAIGRCL